MTTLRELFEVYPPEQRATVPLGLRVDGMLFARVDGSDLLSGEVTADASTQADAALARLRHVLSAGGLAERAEGRVVAHAASTGDAEAFSRAWAVAGIASGGLELETREAVLPAGRNVVLDVLATLPGSGPPELVALHPGAMPVAARLGPVLFAPSLTGASSDGALPDGMPAQVRGAFDNLERLMEQSGVGQGQLLRIAGYMRDLKDKDLLNEEMVARFPRWSEKPVHKYVPAALPPGVEFAPQAIAVAGEERHILEIEGIKHNDPISLGALAGNVFVSSRVQARLEVTAGDQAARLIESHARRLVEHIGGSLDDVSQMVWGIGNPAFEAPVREECARHWPAGKAPSPQPAAAPGVLRAPGAGIAVSC